MKEIIRQEACKILREVKFPKSNYTITEVTASNKLKEDPKIIILHADKRNATLIMNTIQCEEKMEKII